MNILIVGASGATGRLLVQQLLARGHTVKAVVRAADRLPESVRTQPNLAIIEAAVLDLSDAAMAEHVRGCDAVACCLGHNVTFKGIYGKPRRLVTDATRRLCRAIQANDPEQPVKFVLMNTVGNRNRDLDEPASVAQRAVIGLLRVALPPQVDNEQAAEVLRAEIGRHNAAVEWVAVRPDGLTDEDAVTDYRLFPSPIRSPIFNPGKTSRINVAHFMAELIDNDALWQEWQGQMPAVYNAESVQDN